MADIQKALATQVKNIETRTGKTLEQLITHVQGSGLGKHSEIVSMLKSDLGLGYGDANTIAHLAKADAKAPDSAPADPLDTLYVGPKAKVRQLPQEKTICHDRSRYEYASGSRLEYQGAAKVPSSGKTSSRPDV